MARSMFFYNTRYLLFTRFQESVCFGAIRVSFISTTGGSHNVEATNIGNKNASTKKASKSDRFPTDVDARKSIVKVIPTVKSKRPKIDFSKSYTQNIYLAPLRAMQEYVLTPDDLKGLSQFKRRSPYEADSVAGQMITVFLRSDVEKKIVPVPFYGCFHLGVLQASHACPPCGQSSAYPPALACCDFCNRSIEVWGSREALQRARSQQRRREIQKMLEEVPHRDIDALRFPRVVSPLPARRKPWYSTGSGRVVATAVGLNGINALMKLFAWLATGSHSLFAEFVHSMADTCNQLLLSFGIHQSYRNPDHLHPYGYSGYRYVSALISGVGIFCIGSGLSLYHGVSGLLSPGEVLPLKWAMYVLLASFLSESVTLAIAVNEIRSSAAMMNVSFWTYVRNGYDPSVNVVLLEDLAAVMGVAVAATCLAGTAYLGSGVPDACGSLIIGAMLGGVSYFIIHSNVEALVVGISDVQRFFSSIPGKHEARIRTDLENDRIVRSLHDIKATDMGSRMVRFKAEVDFDGRELTRAYLDTVDLDSLLTKLNSIHTTDDLELFLLQHGEGVVDQLGAEIDRIERQIKKKHPEVRHVDLEIL